MGWVMEEGKSLNLKEMINRVLTPLGQLLCIQK
jgi:hypothetical protein